MPDVIPIPDVLTPQDIWRHYRISVSTQKRERAAGAFAPYYSVGRRIYYRRTSFEAWIAAQEAKTADGREVGE